LKLHSVTDIITNSSSEMFVMLTASSASIKDVINKILAVIAPGNVEDWNVLVVEDPNFVEAIMKLAEEDEYNYYRGVLEDIVSMKYEDSEKFRKAILDESNEVFKYTAYDNDIPEPVKAILVNTKTGRTLELNNLLTSITESVYLTNEY
jgi:hypothetical protein